MTMQPIDPSTCNEDQRKLIDEVTLLVNNTRIALDGHAHEVRVNVLINMLVIEVANVANTFRGSADDVLERVIYCLKETLSRVKKVELN